jgi:hypothetical protein
VIAWLIEYFPAFLAKEISYHQPELGFVVEWRVWGMAWHRLTTAMVDIMATLIITAMILEDEAPVNTPQNPVTFCSRAADLPGTNDFRR